MLTYMSPEMLALDNTGFAVRADDGMIVML
jgi:hypothetical protein